MQWSSAAAVARRNRFKRERYSMKPCLMTLWIVALTASAAWSQERKDVPPPPKREDNGPSLTVTMTFIQDKLNDVGPVNFAFYVHDDSSGKDSLTQLKVGSTKVV